MKISSIPKILCAHYLCKHWEMELGLAYELAEAFLEDYKEKKLPVREIHQAHKEGFRVESWVLYELDAVKCKRYLSDARYYSLHPVNGEYTAWLDDKLTLKYLCHGTPLGRYMPDYYYQLDENGNILCLMDCPKESNEATIEDIADLLQQKGALAIKLMSGGFGRGFYKAEFHDGVFILNGAQMGKVEFCNALRQLRGYLITEYLYPHPELKRLSVKTPGCIRYAVGSTNGVYRMIAGGLAIGTKASGYVENYIKGGIWCYLEQDGSFTSGDILDMQTYKNVSITSHPDTGEQLQGRIPQWKNIQQVVRLFCDHFPQLQYMGFDFVVTSDDRVKILEINTLSSLDVFQNNVFSAFDTPAGEFFRSQIEKKFR